MGGIAALAPVNAAEAELNAQYTAMIPASLSAHTRLRREQQRRKRETTRDAANQDEWTRHIAANTMLQALLSEPYPRRSQRRDKIPHTEG